ncbi:hypothetical protein CHH91_02385 [Virgibacillus sp. 7505]|uniref:hypothetical protein n=1 Tax=Virgibacillus sp. 7505 TaxID=2022548 RepID=UPI000BA6E5B9|nr:hypothetical protein [Virgibacillus sp. 7505]PAE17737.1 hypothetical protein CHH91_02385 [Virgibacillus sp. 7505]
MDRDSLKVNLIKCVKELGVSALEDIRFKVTPTVEEGKKLSSTDDFMRLNILSQKNLNGRLFEIDKVVKLISGPQSTFPIWIDVELLKSEDTHILIELRISMRFRKPSLLQNQDTEHPPFRAIKN